MATGFFGNWHTQSRIPVRGCGLHWCRSRDVDFSAAQGGYFMIEVDLGTSLPTGLDFHLQNLGFLGSIRTFSVQLHLFRGAAVQVF